MANEILNSLFLSTVAEANAVGKRILAETGGIAERVAEFLNSSEDERVIKARKFLADAQAKRDEIDARMSEVESDLQTYAESQVQSSPDFDLEAETAKFLELRKKVTAQRAGFAAFGEEPPETEEIVSLKNKGSRSGSTGTGTSRSSFSEIVVNGTVLDKPTFSTAATYISKNYGKVGAADLRESLKNEHGDVSEKYGEQFTFSHTVTKDDKSTTLTIVATPTENVRRKPNSEKSDDNSESEKSESDSAA